MTNKRNFIIVKVLVYTLFIFNFILSTFYLFGQSGGVAINSTGSSADNSAMLDVSSINQGMRIPRVALISTTSALPIANPVNSLLVYDSVTTGDVTPGFYYWDGTSSKWIRFSTGSGGSWSTSGNAGTDTATNFIGTTDDKSWVMKTNSTERMKISKYGNVGIGTSNPASSAILDVSSTTKGLRMPNMTTNQRDAISLPSTGLQIYNTDCGSVDYYNGTCWISMSKTLPQAGPITSSGTTDFCAGQTRAYSVPPLAGATSYMWSVPPGASITSGQGSTSINVTFGNISGSVCVNANNACETSAQTCLAVNINLAPAAPGNITGAISAVPGQTNTVSYSIASIPGASTYNWTVPPGAVITSGTGTTNIVVNYTCNTTAGYVAVTQTAACGTSSPASLAISVSPLLVSAGPAKTGPGPIGGSPTASGGTGTGSYIYAWSPSSGLTSTTIANPTANACTTTTYTITVTDANACTASNLVVVTKNLTASAGANVNNTSTLPVSIGPAIGYGGTGSYNYSWSPTISLVNATVASPTACGGGTYTVTITDANSCTATSTMYITLPASPATLTFNNASTGLSGVIQNWVVPAGTSSVIIDTYGAQGGSSGDATAGGLGARIKGTFAVSAGNILQILIGQKGDNASGSTRGGGGGGGSFVALGSNYATATIMIAAAGGGGGETSGYCGTPGNKNGQSGTSGMAGQNGTPGAGGTGGAGGGAGSHSGGGAGWSSGGGSATASGGIAFQAGGAGGNGYSDGANGGFGGGGGSYVGGAGGGGYSGGGAGGWSNSGCGGGGGSYNGGTSQTNTAGVQSGHGKVIITY
ncbi:MAG: hypothetical protein HGB12_04785 [Bacteroidetes bacterium]|nr:hypothetical protein [Bacteroidota bacterium]